MTSLLGVTQVTPPTAHYDFPTVLHFMGSDFGFPVEKTLRTLAYMASEEDFFNLSLKPLPSEVEFRTCRVLPEPSNQIS